ncbi:MAG: hypothetical protein K9M99_02175 [Candidatus Cloacimonetes bacterium]|nr:hypothetical protein [Candidatus Cloacimonadota bacterium]
MKKSIVLVIMVLGLVSLQAGWVSIQTAEGELFNCESSNRSVTELVFQLDGYEMETIAKAGTEYLQISHPEEGDLLEIGKPDLPVFTTLVAISGQGTPQVSYEVLNSSFLRDVNIYPRQALQLESEPYRDVFTYDEEYYAAGNTFPETEVFMGEPAVMRDVRLVPVTICPFRWNPVSRELTISTEFSVQVSMTPEAGINELTHDSNISRAFEPFYKGQIINYSMTETRDEFQQPSILFIHTNNTQVTTSLAYLTDWKHERGYEVHTASTTQTGTSSTSIKNYIQNAYDSWTNPPEYVVLVGDVGGTYNIPTWTNTWGSYGGEGDQPYSQLAGGDVLADIIVGRLPFGNITELQTMIAKSINYEKQPYIASPDWMETITLVGDPSASGPSTISTCRYVQEVTQAYNPDFSYNEIFSGSYSSQMSSALNAGTLYFCYRGFIGMSGFDTGNINALYNGWMLPFATILTCGTGGFAGTCRSEVFARAGSPTNPKGAVAAVGTATSGTHTCFNNCVTAGMYEGIFNLDIFSTGGALVNGKYNLYLNYPQNPSHYVNIFSHWNNLMGDPSVSLYTGIPQEMNVEYPATVGSGASFLPVVVTDASGNGIENAWVTILKGNDDIFASGYTDASGNIWLSLAEDETGDVTITVTAHDRLSYQDEFTIAAQNVQLNPRETAIDDDNNGSSSGNNNGIINNGETIELDIMVNNSGSQTATGITGAIDCHEPWVEIITAEADYPNIAGGATLSSLSSYVISIDAAAVNCPSFLIEVTVSTGTQEFYSIIELAVSAPSLSFSDYDISGVNGVIDPGETGILTVDLENLGDVSTGQLTGLLASEDNFIQIDDPNGSYNSILPGNTGTNSTNDFELTIHSAAIPGTLLPLSLILSNTDGFQQTIFFNIEVGTVTVNDPLGPDAYGYLCYDDQDSDYIECPSYNWIEINPSLGGNGSLVNISTGGDDCDIETLSFPGNFTFNFYGEHYTNFTVGTAGWIAPGGTQIRSFMNWHLPEAHGPSPMIAAFWDDLHNGSSGHVYTYFNTNLHYYVIEWDHFQNENSNEEETFQIILYDANYYPTSTMDSMIKIQYKVFNNTNSGSYRADHGQFCTVGLEDPSGLVGLEYTFNNAYPTAARTLTNQSAILFSTMPIPPDGPFLTIGGMELDDENGNGNADYGENVYFDLIVNNVGSEIAHNVSVNLETEDSWINIINNSSSYPDIQSGVMEANNQPFFLTVDGNVPDGHMAAITATISCNEGEWQIITELELNAPDLNFFEFFVNDGVDNILDSGETSDVLVRFFNSGGAPVYDAQITLATADNYLNINNNDFNPGDIPGEAFSTGIFSFSAAANAPTGHQATINWSLIAGQDYAVSGTFIFVISQVPVLIDEDFSGNFPPDGWFIDGQNWESGSSSYAGGSAPEAKFNWSPSVNGDQRLVCGPFSTSGSSELDISFRQNVNHFSGTYELKLETSSNGSTWQQAASWPPQNQGATISYVNINTSDVGSPTFYFAFTFSGYSYNINYWYIDDVEIEGVSVEPLGYIEGMVGIGGAGNVQNVSIEVGDQIVHPNSAGNYTVILSPGTYTLTATLPGYDDFVATDILVTQTQTTQQNIILGFIPSPENLSAIAQEDGVMLSWQLSSQEISRDIEYYNIYADFNGDGYQLAGTAAEMSFLHTPYLPGNYHYYVTAYYTESGETLPSNDAYSWYNGEVHFGDINESSVVDAYDTALLLQYFVGFDPLPELDPAPWENWRLYLGDVDDNGNMEAFDASLILQYIVGLIDQFPCEPAPVVTRKVNRNLNSQSAKD